MACEAVLCFTERCHLTRGVAVLRVTRFQVVLRSIAQLRIQRILSNVRRDIHGEIMIHFITGSVYNRFSSIK